MRSPADNMRNPKLKRDGSRNNASGHNLKHHEAIKSILKRPLVLFFYPFRLFWWRRQGRGVRLAEEQKLVVSKGVLLLGPEPSGSHSFTKTVILFLTVLKNVRKLKKPNQN